MSFSLFRIPEGIITAPQHVLSGVRDSSPTHFIFLQQINLDSLLSKRLRDAACVGCVCTVCVCVDVSI